MIEYDTNLALIFVVTSKHGQINTQLVVLFCVQLIVWSCTSRWNTFAMISPNRSTIFRQHVTFFTVESLTGIYRSQNVLNGETLRLMKSMKQALESMPCPSAFKVFQGLICHTCQQSVSVYIRRGQQRLHVSPLHFWLININWTIKKWQSVLGFRKKKDTKQCQYLDNTWDLRKEEIVRIQNNQAFFLK